MNCFHVTLQYPLMFYTINYVVQLDGRYNCFGAREFLYKLDTKVM